ncbi:MAG: DegT/DnrJ/EryC1/StrS family aminotransferase, partial [Candidatus Caldatribacterium sp.]|nr:DegT/DnrJ/EryC1/StrS family aminotransferase [Candidatus Caldatribacterium sp.]
GDIAELCRSLRNQGRRVMGGWLEHEELGFNYRMTEMSAALGISQLRRIDTLLANRDRVARLYTAYLRGLYGVQTPVVRPSVRMSWFVYVVALPEKVSRRRVMEYMEEQGVPTRAYFPPVNLQGYIRRLLKTHEGMLPVTESIAQRTLALPFYGAMTEEDVRMVVEVFRAALDKVA